MRLNRRLIVLSVGCTGALVVNAFSSPTISLARRETRLYSSPLDDDDELSRLIGKRSEIKRKIKKSSEEEPTPESLEFDITEDDLDWDELPEFKTKRVARNKPKASEAEAKKKKEEEDKGSGLDFLADYEDEGDFHIPNRIGISTVAWGEVSRGFVSAGKLTKKMRREGKFVPGDLQVSSPLFFFFSHCTCD
jgi:hypothetical protein